jgi:hypothetical protein
VELGLCLVSSYDGSVSEGKHFCGGFLVALGYSLHFPHQLCLPQVPHHPTFCMSRLLSSTEAHDQTTNPSTFSTHHYHPVNDQHNVQVPDSSKHAVHR